MYLIVNIYITILYVRVVVMKEQYTKTELSLITNEVSGDYILPDSFPDVKSVLSCHARIYDLKKYFGGAEGEISGSIMYNIMFSAIGENDDDTICSVSFTDDFKMTCKYKNPANSGVGAHTRLTANTCRMANPRKFSIKSTLETLMFEDSQESAYPQISASAPADADFQYKWGECEICRCKTVLLCEHSFSDNIELDLKLPEIAEVIHYDVSLNVRDDRSVDLRDTPVKLGGNFALNILYKDKENKLHGVSRDIPFGISINDDESAMLETLNDSSVSIVPSVYISAVNLNVGKNQYDEAKVLEFDADYDIDLLLMSGEAIKFVTDAYSTKYDSECKFEMQTIQKPVARIKNNFTYTDTREKNELGLDNMSLVSASIPVFSDIHTEKSGNYVSVSGKISERVTIIDEGKIRGKEINVPFTYKSNVNAIEESLSMIGNTVVADNRVRCDHERVYTDAEIYLDYLLTGKESINVCKSIGIGECVKESDNALFCVYYPSPDESLWEMAKKKKTTVEKLLSLNPEFSSRCDYPIIIE